MFKFTKDSFRFLLRDPFPEQSAKLMAMHFWGEKKKKEKATREIGFFFYFCWLLYSLISNWVLNSSYITSGK